ncbi:fimbrial assembly protein FimA [Streptomyces abyssalis]|uniref:Fimbrial assembly protein FimA n=1 Tax=Streptomyces abyssalis TaxID=933944 RepID=A0A1E7JT11_9ACTN|nr:DUF1028 domain-containing protein [Streptomyces abyssalis]OEU92007.1 fimbrial assembly protein FimA [Streptomyces abyssalis]OEU94715.1 fimbrial assembly protein FimA [Streptomyces abyssalis]
MTFSILARDEDSGAFGMAVTSSSPCVAARCLHLRCGVGGVASQNITDPRFGDWLLDRLVQGDSADEALAGLRAHDDTLDYRQLAVIGARGAPAVHSGGRTLGVHHSRTSEHAVAAGNLLDNTGVVDAVLDGFESATGEFEQRLLAALEAGLAAGGEAGDLRSAGLGVVRDAGWRETDLRVDWSRTPVSGLQDLLEVWLPQRRDYVTRGIDPSTAPAYGVPGDE